MPARRVCSVPGCPDLSPASGRCPEHRRAAERAREGTTALGYSRAHRTRFRPGVLARDRSCVLCGAPATVADHWPLDRRELAARGMDPDDPRHGRGLCASCHGRETARHQPGGWHQGSGG